LFIENFGKQGGPLSAFITGLFYTSYATSPVATGVIYYLGKVQAPLMIAAIGAFGSVITDYIFFRFFKKRVVHSLNHIFHKFKFKKSYKNTFKILALLLAILILGSPLPDEIGVSILASINFKFKWFFVLSYFPNFVGILTIAWLGSVL
jgi:hypothetical protein